MRLILLSMVLAALSISTRAQAEGLKTRPAKTSVALTFDDGPDPRHTQAILDILARYKIHATFFIVGKNAKEHPELVKAIEAAGHSIGNHSYQHPSLARLSSERVTKEIEKTDDVLFAITGEHPKCLRPPYGASSDRVVAIAKKEGLKTVRWDVASLDYTGLPPAQVVHLVLSKTHGGQIILMHDLGRGGDRSVKALPAIIEGFQKRNIGFETICE
jgi:peptidoglycan/xylan/chitin deacetylase (PgdA/CDA1 family)